MNWKQSRATMEKHPRYERRNSRKHSRMSRSPLPQFNDNISSMVPPRRRHGTFLEKLYEGKGRNRKWFLMKQLFKMKMCDEDGTDMEQQMSFRLIFLWLITNLSFGQGCHFSTISPKDDGSMHRYRSITDTAEYPSKYFPNTQYLCSYRQYPGSNDQGYKS